MPTKTEKNKQAKDISRSSLDIEAIKADFPILNEQVNGHRLVYLDSAATSQKPREVIDRLADYYLRYNSNIHRGLHTLAEKATSAFEAVRTQTAAFIGAKSDSEIVFTRGTTESLNLVAQAWGDANIGEGDEIVVTEMEHHANMVPWYVLAKRKNAILRKIPITPCGHLDQSNIDEIINPRTKVVSIAHMSNVLGTINPVKQIARLAHDVGAIVVIDGAQSAPHMPVNVNELDADFFAFSSHKMLGPTGVGVLWAKEELLRQMEPCQFGGEMIGEVGFDKVTWADLPHKFEAGTPNIADVIGFGAALDYLNRLGMDEIRRHEIELTQYTIESLSEIKGIDIQGSREYAGRGGAVSFTDVDIHPHDISTFLDSKGIAIRAGHHCAQPLMKAMGTIATARASLYIYNDRDDVDALVEAIIEMRRYFGV